MESPAGKTAQTSEMQTPQQSQQPTTTPRPTLTQTTTSQSQQATIEQPRPTGRSPNGERESVSRPQTPQPETEPSNRKRLPSLRPNRPGRIVAIEDPSQQRQGQPSPQRPPRPMLSPEVSLEAQGFKPPYTKGNNEVKIVDDPAPSSPSFAYDDHHPKLQPHGADDGITLADIPQVVQVAQARAQYRPLPPIPFIAELSALELAIVKLGPEPADDSPESRDTFADWDQRMSPTPPPIAGRPPGESNPTFGRIPSRPLQGGRETVAEPHPLNNWVDEIHDTLGGMKEPGAQSQKSLHNTPIRARESSTVHPIPDSSILVEPEACRRLISLAFSTHEVTSLIEAIFTNKAEIRMVRSLSGDAAQTFVDVVHKVRFRVLSFPKHSTITFILFDLLDLYLQPVRP